MLAKCKAAEPGTVKEYNRHILLRVPVEGEGPADQAWPRSVESHKNVDPLVRALKVATKQKSVQDKVMLSAYEPLEGPPQSAQLADILLFPDGLQLCGVPLPDLTATVLEVLTAPGKIEVGDVTTGLYWAPLPPLVLMVCCHNKRDERCGALGPPLAARLAEVLASKGYGPEDAVVLKNSHPGGHVYAGNVIAYRPGHPGHGDWYGGVHAAIADDWLEAFLSTPAELDGGVGDPALRPYWRGRLDMSKEAQLAVFEEAGKRCAGGNKDIEDLAEREAAVAV